MLEGQKDKKGSAPRFAEHLSPASLLSVEGQILFLLSNSDRTASEIYGQVAASQPTVSKRLARMLQLGLIDVAPSSSDRRIAIYRMTDACRKSLYKTDHKTLVLGETAEILPQPSIKSK